MSWAALISLAVVAAAPAGAAPGAGEAAPADPELEVLAMSLLPEQRQAVDAACGGLGRLPRYRLDLKLDAEEGRLTGFEQISLVAPAGAGELYVRVPANASFHDVGLGPAVAIAEVSRDGRPLRIESLENGVYRILLGVPPAAGERLELELAFTARIPDLSEQAGSPDQQLLQQALALFGGGGTDADEPTDFGAFGRLDRVFNLSGFYPELVRVEGGVPDTGGEPGRGDPRWGPLANYTVSLVAPFPMQVAGTGAEIGQTPEKDGGKRTTRVAAAVRGVALIVGEGWQEQRAQAGKVRVRVVAPEAQSEQARKLLDVARRTVEHFSSIFGPYPWTDLELAAAPVVGGVEAISFPGLVLASNLLWDAKTTATLRMFAPNADKLTDSVLEMTVAHQVSHQWWRGIVGSDYRARPALEEPLATYSAVLYVEKRRGGKAAADLFKVQVRDAYRSYRMVGGVDNAVDRPLDDYQKRGEMVGLLNGKGAVFYERLRKLMGDKAFFAALKRHYQQNRFREVSSDGVLVAAAAVAPGKAQAALALYERFMRGRFGDADCGRPQTMEEVLKNQGVQLDPASASLLNQMSSALGGGPPVAQPVAPAPSTPKQSGKAGGGQRDDQVDDGQP